MINSKNKSFVVKIKVLIFLLKIKITKIINKFNESNCDLTTFKDKFYNLDQERLVIEQYHSSWRNLTRLIMNKTFIFEVQRFLVILKRLISLIYNNDNDEYDIKYTRKFNTLFTIAFFSKMVCDNNVKNKDSLIHISKDIVDSFISLKSGRITNLSVIHLDKQINKYFILFESWQEHDKEFMVFTLAKQYLLNEIKMSKPLSNVEENQQMYLNAFKREQLSIKQDVKYLGSEIWKTKFNDLIDNVNNYNSIVKSLYWLDIDYNLSKNPPNVETVLKLFMETKRLMKNLVSNRTDILNEIDETLEEQIINAVLNESEIDEPFFYRKCEFILEKLKQLQSPAMDIPLENFKKVFSLKIANREYFKDLIPFFFRYVLDSLEQIHDEKEAFLQFIKN